LAQEPFWLKHIAVQAKLCLLYSAQSIVYQRHLPGLSSKQKSMITKHTFDDWRDESSRPRLETPLQAMRRMERTNCADITWRQTVEKLAHKEEGYPRLEPALAQASPIRRGRNFLPRADPKFSSARSHHRNGWALSPSRSPERRQQAPQGEESTAECTSRTCESSADEFRPAELPDTEIRDTLVTWGKEEGLSMDDGRSQVSTQYDDEGQPVNKLPDYLVARPEPEFDGDLDSPRSHGKRTALSRYTRAQTRQPQKGGLTNDVIPPALLSAPMAGVLFTALI
jgi:hypothetical protein